MSLETTRSQDGRERNERERGEERGKKNRGEKETTGVERAMDGGAQKRRDDEPVT